MSENYDPNTAGMFTLTKELYVKGWTNWGSRSTRREYWLGGLGWMILLLPLTILTFYSMDWSAAIDDNPFAMYTPLTWGCHIVLILLTLIPGTGTVVRRFHDIGRSGWWYLLIMVLSYIPLISIISSVWMLVWCCADSVPATNKWGMSPKYKK